MTDESTPNCAAFERLAELPDEAIELAPAALAIAADEYPDLDTVESLAILDALADQARPRVEKAGCGLERVKALIGFLHEEVGFRGNLDSYYDPRNSFLNDVLSRGLGIPITLAIVYIEVARRLGLTLRGVNFPGHFLLRFDGEETVFIDPFDPCHFMCPTECETLLSVMSEGRIRFDARFLEPATPRQIVVRILKNLKLVYFRQGKLDRAVAVIDRILQLAPDQIVEYRDRGVAHLKLEDHRAALEDLTKYLGGDGEAPDRSAVQATVDYLRLRVAPMN